jgi:hypothetical protein
MVKNFLFSTSASPALGSTQPRIHWIPWPLSPGVRLPVRDADHSPPANAEVKKMWTMPSSWLWRLCRSCINRRFGGTYRLHLQGRKIRERGTSVSSGCRRKCLYPFIVLLYDLTFLRRLKMVTSAWSLRRCQYVNNHCRCRDEASDTGDGNRYPYGPWNVGDF